MGLPVCLDVPPVHVLQGAQACGGHHPRRVHHVGDDVAGRADTVLGEDRRGGGQPRGIAVINGERDASCAGPLGHPSDRLHVEVAVLCGQPDLGDGRPVRSPRHCRAGLPRDRDVAPFTDRDIGVGVVGDVDEAPDGEVGPVVRSGVDAQVGVAGDGVGADPQAPVAARHVESQCQVSVGRGDAQGLRADDEVTGARVVGQRAPAGIAEPVPRLEGRDPGRPRGLGDGLRRGVGVARGGICRERGRRRIGHGPASPGEGPQFDLRDSVRCSVDGQRHVVIRDRMPTGAILGKCHTMHNPR